MKPKKWLLYLSLLGGGVAVIYAIRKIFESEIEKRELKMTKETYDKIVALKEKMFNEIGERFLKENTKYLYDIWTKYKNEIFNASKKTGVPIVILTSLIRQESGGNPKAYRYEPRWDLHNSPKLPDDPLYPNLTFDNILKFYVDSNRIKGYLKISTPHIQHERNLSDWEIYGAQGIKGIIDILKVRDLVGKGKLQEAIKKMNQSLKNYKAHIILGASIGLTQVMFNYAIDLDKSLLKEPLKMFDPAYNIELGARFLRAKYEATGNWMDALARYNSGRDYEKAPPITKKYVKDISMRFMTPEEFGSVFV